MNKQTFIYYVNGQTFSDNDVFGKAWHDAKKVAQENHCEIWRDIVNNETCETIEEFYANGIFLYKRFYKPGKAYTFQ